MSTLSRCLSLVALALLAIPASAADWTAISPKTLATVAKVGYPGKTAGVAVDPATGDVYMVICDNGIWKSADHGETFARVDEKNIGGRCETGAGLNFDPAGKRLMCFMIYGDSAATDDGGKTWTKSKTSHLDFGGVDWHDTGKCYLAVRHEKGGLITLSTDGGQSWKDLQKGFTHLGLFSGKVLVGSKGKGIVRSEDGGENWTAVSEFTPSAPVMRVQGNVGYWLAKEGLIVSRDQGKTWEKLGSPVNATIGPMFGKTADHLIVVSGKGFHESKDAGKTWELACPLPPGFDAGWVGPNYAWDVANDIFYASSMGKDTFRYSRK